VEVYQVSGKVKVIILTTYKIELNRAAADTFEFASDDLVEISQRLLKPETCLSIRSSGILYPVSSMSSGILYPATRTPPSGRRLGD
jgi:hypothetical protein